MRILKRGILLGGGLLLLSIAMSACEYLDPVDPEAVLLEPPTVQECIDNEVGMRPVPYLERRRESAREKLQDLYNERMDEANSAGVGRLEKRLERAEARLDRNYDQRKERLESRLERNRN